MLYIYIYNEDTRLKRISVILDGACLKLAMTDLSFYLYRCL